MASFLLLTSILCDLRRAGDLSAREQSCSLFDKHISHHDVARCVQVWLRGDKERCWSRIKGRLKTFRLISFRTRATEID